MSTGPSSGDNEGALPEIAGYRLLRLIGHGGMSMVYLARQVSLDREVALKVMLPEALTDEVSRRRFENEARTIARLEHPHIVGIYEVGRSRDGLPYYAMPYLPRGHLGQRQFAGDHARVSEVMRALLSALEYAHARGIVHRDVKAENVLFDEAGRPLLADFGIALRRGYGTRVTTAGLAVGSTAYMPPEQARGENVDGRADLYSVGVLGWEMLTGRLPYNAGDALSMAIQHTQDPIPRLPPELRHWQRFFDRALAKSPAARFHNARQMREALDRVPERGMHPLLATRTMLLRGIERTKRLPKIAWIAIALLLATGLGMAMRDLQSPRQDGFFRASVSGGDGGLPVPGAQPGQAIVGDTSDPMLRPLPESAAERWVNAAEQQLRERNLTAPRGNNAYDSLLAAWHADAAHPRLADTLGKLTDALGTEAERRLRADDEASARDYLDRANTLAGRMGQSDGAAMRRLRERIGKVVAQQVDRAAARFDRAAAMRAVASARKLGLAPATLAALDARAAKIPQPGDRIPGDAAGMTLARSGDRLLAVARSEVTVAEFGRFAAATRRPASLCRERASLLRIVKPRSWQAPGFAQSAQQPVVCVSWTDAAAYAQWLSQRTGQRYRLPRANEAGVLPASGGARPVAQWLDACGRGCTQRLASGRSWRGASGSRPLEANRGYDDVGFRIVRDP